MIKRLQLLSFFLLFTLILSVSSTQIGEVAGPVSFNVSAGSSQSLPITIVNGGNNPLFFNATPIITTVILNETAPNVTISPKIGTINPHSQVILNLTAIVLGNDKPGLEWYGQVSVVSNSTTQINGSGAIIREGTLKVFTVTSAEPKFNFVLVITIIIVIILLAILIYYLYKKRSAKKNLSKKKHNTKK